MNTPTLLLSARTIALVLLCVPVLHAAEPAPIPSRPTPAEISGLFTPPPEFAGQSGKYNSLLTFRDGTKVRTPADWQKRRAEIRAEWERVIGTWPPLLEKPTVETVASTNREGFTQHTV